MAWCFNPMPMEEFVPACARMGLVGVEGIDAKYYPLMKEHGLKVSLCSGHGFKQGPLNPEYHEHCRTELRKAIDRAVKWDCQNVITFTGMREKEISDQQSQKNCVELWKSVIDYAEAKNVTLVLEHLNSRDDSHPMKGHPGYFGDDVDLCIDLIKQVDSPNMKLLFDFYHVQVMNGDVIRRFQQGLPYIGHLHTAGNPGRCELDENQEMNYAAIIKAVAESDYDGYVVQEYIPTWDDKLGSLRHGVALCDV
ncbi:sugar phosphate isomerase [Bremerella cremea]|uniref:Sugar phosphate isomerase n=2 Tax=Bremerella cremea TaxID=1031537 RepID=A0A368KWY7_9BACT|nr:sugar phosphate isomerase [Bremerella cremea]